MQRKILLSFIFNFLFAIGSMASHMAGGDISYRYLEKNKFEVTFKLYRDCRGGAILVPKFGLWCVSTSSFITLTPTLISIRDISTVCRTWVNTCSPPNKSISSTMPIFEELCYKTILNFYGNESAFQNCCIIKIGMGECCRSSGITSGAAGEDFWVTSTLDLCKAPTNSSPEFLLEPAFIMNCNQPAFRNNNAKDTVDGDSVSFNWTEPMKNWTSKVTWSGARSYKSPVSDYWPAGYDKNKGPKPDADPPIGTYLDPETGILIFTPTDCSEITQIAIMAKEWRKDSTGKYQLIGEVTRDIRLMVFQSSNNAPLISGPYRYTACEGLSIVINISTDDKQFIPPPPAKAAPPDTTSITWDYGIKEAALNHVSDTVRLRVGRFTWTPPIGSASTMPHNFTIKVSDNSCNSNGISYKTFSIKVNKKMKVNHQLNKLKDNVYLGTGGMDTSFKFGYSQWWQVLDSNGNYIRTVNNNLNQYSLNHIIKPFDNKHTADSIIFLRNGKYIISHRIFANSFCTPTLFDTITIKNIPFEVSILSAIDTIVCQYSKIRFYAKVSRGQKPIKYTWKIDGKLTNDTLAYIDYAGLGNVFYELEVKDSNNAINSTSLRVSLKSLLPKFKTGNDTTLCINENLKIKAIPLTKYEYIIKWLWTKDGIIVSNIDSLKTKTAGTYIAMAENSDGCFSFDTLKLAIAPNVKPELISGIYCQNKNELNQSEIILNPPNLNQYTNMEWSLIKSLKDKFGNLNSVGKLVKDIDSTAGYNFKMQFGKDLIDLDKSNKDSLKFVLTATDSFHCKTNDTMTLVILKSPEISTLANQNYCWENAIDLTKNTTSNLQVLYMAENKTGYDMWPKEGEITNGFIKEKYMKPNGGNYFVKLKSSNEMCEAVDSINLLINPMPLPRVSIKTFGDSVIFTDISLNTTSRKWYVNAVFKTSDKSFVLSKTFAHLKPINLELKNASCNSDTFFTVKTLTIENPKSDLIKIYPNPATNILTIEQSKPLNNGFFEIYNTIGELVLSGYLVEKETLVNIENFTRGLYFLKVKNEKISLSFQFIKEE